MTISITVPHNDAFALRVMAEALLRIAEREPVAQTVEPAVADLSVLDRSIPTMAEIAADLPTPPAPTVAEVVEQVVADMPTPPAPTADSDGYPWDQRIHADSKTLNTDGTWRARRKPSDMDAEQWATYQESVRGELKALMSIPAIVPPPVPVPPVPPAVETSPLDAPSTFPQLMIWITSHVTDDRKGDSVTACVDQVLAQHGLQALPQLTQRPDLIPAVYASLREVL